MTFWNFSEKLLSKSNSCEIWKSVYFCRITVSIVDLRWRTCSICRCLVWFRDDAKQQEKCNTLFSALWRRMEMNHSLKCTTLLKARVHISSAHAQITQITRKTFVYWKKETVAIVLINLVKQKTWHISVTHQNTYVFFAWLHLDKNMPEKPWPVLECLQLSVETFKINSAASSSAQTDQKLHVHQDSAFPLTQVHYSGGLTSSKRFTFNPRL